MHGFHSMPAESLTSGIPARDVIDKDSWGPWKEQAGMNCPTLLIMNTDMPVERVRSGLLTLA